MDDSLRGRKVRDVISEIIRHTVRMSDEVQDVDSEEFHEFAYERLLDYVMEQGRTRVTHKQVFERSRKIWKSFIQSEKKRSSYIVEEISRRFSEENDEAYELIREDLIEKVSEAEFEHLSRRSLEEWAAIKASEYFWS